MELRTKEQNRKIYWYLDQLGINDEFSRHNLARAFSGGRVEKTSELSRSEAEQLIEGLKREYRRQLGDARNKVLRVMYKIPIFISVKADKKILDETKVKEWMLKYSCKKKLMREYTLKELPCLLSQLQIMYRNYKLKAQ